MAGHSCAFAVQVLTTSSAHTRGAPSTLELTVIVSMLGLLVPPSPSLTRRPSVRLALGLTSVFA